VVPEVQRRVDDRDEQQRGRHGVIDPEGVVRIPDANEDDVMKESERQDTGLDDPEPR
jgi:hypothetical protein